MWRASGDREARRRWDGRPPIAEDRVNTRLLEGHADEIAPDRHGGRSFDSLIQNRGHLGPGLRVDALVLRFQPAARSRPAAPRHLSERLLVKKPPVSGGFCSRFVHRVVSSASLPAGLCPRQRETEVLDDHRGGSRPGSVRSRNPGSILSEQRQTSLQGEDAEKQRSAFIGVKRIAPMHRGDRIGTTRPPPLKTWPGAPTSSIPPAGLPPIPCPRGSSQEVLSRTRASTSPRWSTAAPAPAAGPVRSARQPDGPLGRCQFMAPTSLTRTGSSRSRRRMNGSAGPTLFLPHESPFRLWAARRTTTAMERRFDGEIAPVSRERLIMGDTRIAGRCRDSAPYTRISRVRARRSAPVPGSGPEPVDLRAAFVPSTAGRAFYE